MTDETRQSPAETVSHTWLPCGGPGWYRFQLQRGHTLVATIQKRAGRQYKWWGFETGDDTKHGPFASQADAKLWAEQLNTLQRPEGEL